MRSTIGDTPSFISSIYLNNVYPLFKHQLVLIESEIKFSPIDKDIDSKLVIKSDEEKVAEGVQKEADPSKEKPKLPPRK